MLQPGPGLLSRTPEVIYKLGDMVEYHSSTHNVAELMGCVEL